MSATKKRSKEFTKPLAKKPKVALKKLPLYRSSDDEDTYDKADSILGESEEEEEDPRKDFSDISSCCDEDPKKDGQTYLSETIQAAMDTPYIHWFVCNNGEHLETVKAMINSDDSILWSSFMSRMYTIVSRIQKDGKVPSTILISLVSKIRPMDYIEIESIKEMMFFHKTKNVIGPSPNVFVFSPEEPDHAFTYRYKWIVHYL